MKIIIVFITLAATGLLSAADSPANAKANPTTVKIDNFSFTPQTLTVRAGTTVTWNPERTR